MREKTKGAVLLQSFGSSNVGFNDINHPQHHHEWVLKPIKRLIYDRLYPRLSHYHKFSIQLAIVELCGTYQNKHGVSIPNSSCVSR